MLGIEATVFMPEDAPETKRRIAEEAGATISDGTLDAGVEVQMKGTEGVDVDSRFVFTNLSMSEPPGGPVSSVLRLPAPLDTVLWVLRNNRGEQVVQLRVLVQGGTQSLDHGFNVTCIHRESARKNPAILTSIVLVCPPRNRYLWTGIPCFFFRC